MTTNEEGQDNSPALGGGFFHPDPKTWMILLGDDDADRKKIVRHIEDQGTRERYVLHLIDVIATLVPSRRVNVGKSIALLGDPRFEGRYSIPHMGYVPGGEVIMGSNDFPEERPLHKVMVAPFYLSFVPVTNASYSVFLEATEHIPPPGWRASRAYGMKSNQPVTQVSAFDAMAYCEWLANETGYRYRLPTEAEWVMAARGIDDSRIFPWGRGFSPNLANCWEEPSLKTIAAVGLFPEGASPFGHLDMSGNIWEWCSSLFWAYPYRDNDGREDLFADQLRVVHGGSWRSRLVSIRCSARQGEPSSDRPVVVGFRIARDA